MAAIEMNGVADRAYDWFYGENAICKVMQGRAAFEKGGKVYYGAPILQNAPLYASLGNHDIMERYKTEGSLHRQGADPVPRWYGEEQVREEILHGKKFASEEEKEQRISDLSINTKTWEEIFTLPKNPAENKRNYAKIAKFRQDSKKKTVTSKINRSIIKISGEVSIFLGKYYA